jgi:DNA-binding transcriptional LysR family regulator
MELTQRLLEQFIVVADEGNIGRAAERLSMTQPPLTQAIRRLERGIGVRLFDRTPRGVELTAAGRSFRDDAQRLSAAQQAAVRRTRRVAAGLQGVVDVGFVAGLAYRFAPDLLRTSAAMLPDLTLRPVQMAPPLLLDAVRSAQLDLGFIRGPANGADGLVAVEVGREKMVVALPRRHRLSQQSAVTLADLRDEPLVFPSQQALPGLFAWMRAAFRQAGVTPRIVAHADELSGYLTYPIAGLAAAVVPEQITAVDHPEVVYARLAGQSDGHVTSILAVHRPRVDPAVIRLLDLLTNPRSGQSSEVVGTGRN